MEALPMGFEISEEVSISFNSVMVIAENKAQFQQKRFGFQGEASPKFKLRDFKSSIQTAMSSKYNF